MRKRSDFDTNKLPPLEEEPTPEPARLPKDKIEINLTPPKSRIKPDPRGTDDLTKADAAESPEELELEVADEIDDLAPLSMRFGAGVFDLIAGAFLTLLVLSPFIISGGNWLTASGLLAGGAAFAIMTFLYLTISVAFFGRSVGMRLFSLEILDAEENVYPNLHQSAVNASVFIISLASLGLGFLPLFFNEEKRAAHDILSGTILLREL
jgi:uncharacterized RDD family membrane protein YckC